MTTRARFWSKVDRGGPQPAPPLTSRCWVWTAAKRGGYGRFYMGRRADGRTLLVQAHNWAYQSLVGTIPTTLELDHLCRNRSCVNPEHLELVTHRANVLRGEGVAAHHARVTHCPQGHSYSGANLKIKQGKRFCRRCKQRQDREYYHREKAAR